MTEVEVEHYQHLKESRDAAHKRALAYAKGYDIVLTALDKIIGYSKDHDDAMKIAAKALVASEDAYVKELNK